jgi:hypothetical protein
MRLERFLLHVRLGGDKPASITTERWRGMLLQAVSQGLVDTSKLNVKLVLSRVV